MKSFKEKINFKATNTAAKVLYLCEDINSNFNMILLTIFPKSLFIVQSSVSIIA